ncbi:transport protein (probable substrate cationic amino acids) [Natronomonas pharaonis DSM 2160]|uniref:Transport protein (Probable substrate cationic amino acids) n=1 Tax=Natronomonas pharaonis (strain ATCC 35678 / DSM 2160 / CIP 103997 / JCM 8858 / NBRC 14720 / NCIMB 2260 / Gabara) TaxID=348780 RepID=A0A1U7EW41_NATPD|nr:APC family permease [Natronomonas pharaonis]CAI49282.1 transport protein (probable substrate cationic amino acids) [Natronomonas pharaonis DSM 2160]
MPPEQQAVTSESDLDRTVGLAGALTIGVGTMIGAGIFVFPGLAAGRAGPAAALSFAIGAVIALLVALPTAELATAMPKSGGGYYFISRSLGALPGAVVGVSLGFGLVFASAFYLVGFGEYAVSILEAAGVVGEPPVAVGPITAAALLGIVAGIGLTAISILGTENTETLQNAVVGLLLAILAVFLSASGLELLGVVGDREPATGFAPAGYEPVLTTAALVFTSYLGFAQIATVGEDIVEPDRNLPLAMVGSVVLVGILYVVTLLIAGSTFAPETIGPMGETAIVEVARVYLGPLGAASVLLAGLLATVSSANASILSASRTLYALSADRLAPPQAAELSHRYGTPHFALSFAGGVTVLLVAAGRTEVLAEVASFLHLVMYGLMCLALLKLRHEEPAWYQPSFECPGYPAVPIAGGLASFGLIYYMQPISRRLGAVIAVVAVGWYFLYAEDVSLREELQ